MSITHIPFYPSDWLGGTRSLTDVETGVYITLICQMYEMAGPIKRDDDRMYRFCGSKSKASFVKTLDHLIAEGKVTNENGHIFNDKVQEILNNVVEKSTKARASAQRRWDKKPKEINGSDYANASETHMPLTCYPKPKPKKIDTKVSTKKRAARLPDDWFLSKVLGDWSLSEGYTKETIRFEADKFRDYWIGVGGQKGRKLDWDATWRNWIRNAKGKINGHSQQIDSIGDWADKAASLDLTPPPDGT